MKLSHLLKNIEILSVEGRTDVDITGIVIDGKQAEEGSLYVCLKGNFDGHDFARQAVGFGAKAVICERDCDVNATKIFVKDTRKALSLICAEFYGHPEKQLKIVGVTGTNGKTTTTYIVKHVLDKVGIKCGVIGTLGVKYGNCFKEPSLTTPDPIELFSIFNDMVKADVKVAVMEVSAHALYWDKVEGVKFEIGVFTNLSQDHLDFFEDINSYALTKTKLFEKERCKYAVINVDNKMWELISKKANKTITYGIENPSDVFAIDIEETKEGVAYVLNLFDKIYYVNSNLMGKFNVYNSLAAATVCALLGVKTDLIGKYLSEKIEVSGRMEKIYSGDFDVYIDYAHTPDGLEKSLDSLRSVCSGKLISVFGCGGNRDSDKRKKMGEISAKIADFTVITSDNPRFEDPMKIIRSIEDGVLSKTKNYIIVEDRLEGIKYALNYAKKGDVVLIAGKGSEKYQEILGVKRIFNDKDAVLEILS
ncbi:MAG: UDP-N-acetylmuramoyl-L-alanyl-D-glutamate--2,6-diaminopimelate ligase [Clostridia bacterium]|nr:UDP-N-acetylmuramoyl-L-alanyl-D-glutamate--2,6-diaminopimelate ligase [Clostridia bacterium]